MLSLSVWQGKEAGHLLNEISSPPPPCLSSAHRADTYSWPIEVSAFAADLMIARLLSPAPSHPAVRLRKPAYLTAPDIVVVVVGGLGNRREEAGEVCGGVRGVEWYG